MTRPLPARCRWSLLFVVLAIAVSTAARAETGGDDTANTRELCRRLFDAIDEPAITFGLQGHELRPSGHAALDRIINFARNCPHGTIVIIGHSDSIGDEAFNIHISLRRAQAVADYLQLGGVRADRIATEGRGSARPIADNDTRSGRAKNRRIELQLVLPAGSE